MTVLRNVYAELGVILFGIFLFASNVFAFPPITSVHGICGAPLSVAEQKVVNATGAMIPKSMLFNNGNGTYSISWNPLTQYYGYPVDPGQSFYGINSTSAGRTAVLLGRTMFITAAHKFSFDPSQYAVVFAPKYSAASCSEFAWSNIPSDNVYFGTLSGKNNLIEVDSSKDYMTFNVDRYVVDRKPVKIRRSGAPRKSDKYILVSNFLWGGLRVETSGRYVWLNDTVGSSQIGYYFFEGLNPLDGSSGGAVFNVDDEVIDVGVAGLMSGISYVNAGMIQFIDMGVMASTNTPLIMVKDAIPRTEILVDPVVDVLHVGDIGGAVTNPVSSYTLTAALGGNQYDVSVTDPPYLGSPTLSTNPSIGSHLLSLIHPTTMTVTASTAGVTQCGIWDYVVNVKDVYNDQNNYLRHRFEIGVEQVSVSDSDPWNVEIFGSSVPASKTIVVKNVRPTQTAVRVGHEHVGVPNQMVLFDGGLTSVFTLAPMGQPGDTRNVVVSINPATSFPVPGVTSTSKITISPTNLGCTVDPVLEIPVSLKTGSQVGFAVGSGDDLQQPSGGTALGAVQTILIPMTGTSGWCVNGMGLDVGFLDDNGFGPAFPGGATNLNVVVESPGGIRSNIWNLNVIPAGSEAAYVGSEQVNYWGYPINSAIFHIDQSSAPPLGPGNFSPFIGVQATGTWKLELSRSNGMWGFAPTHARLRFKGLACP